MSAAYDDLHEALTEGYRVGAVRAKGMIDAYAHELAEKIRQHWYPRFPGKAEYTRGMDDGYEHAADLIDPEVRE